MKTATKRIESFEEACTVQGLDAKNALPYPTPENADQENTNAFVMMKIIVKALRGDWEPDWTNYDQDKWTPYFYDNSSGFALYAVFYSITFTFVGARLCFPTREDAKYAGTQFIEIYKKLLK